MYGDIAIEDGYNLETILSSLDLSKSTWYYHHGDKVSFEEKYSHLRPILEDIINVHPEYGYRRIKAELQTSHGLVVNHKLILKLLRHWDLNIRRVIRKSSVSRVRRTIKEADDKMNLLSQLDDISLFQVAVTDFTEIKYSTGRKKAYFIPILGYCSKMVYGWALGNNPDTVLALAAWNMAKDCFRAYNVDYKGMIVHHDRDTVFTGHRWLRQLLINDCVRVSYALRGAKDNVEMESFNGHFKGEAHSLFWESPNIEALNKVVVTRVCYYNENRLHSSLDYETPVDYIKNLKA